MTTVQLFYLTACLSFLAAQASYVAETWEKANSDNEARELRGHFTTFDHPDKPVSVPTYVSGLSASSPAKTARPAVIVAHHAVGIYNHAFLRQFADDLTDHGFVAVLPDFFHRVWNETVPNGLGIPVEQMNIMAALGSLNDREIVEDLTAVLHGLEHNVGVSPAGIGILGFCMGGRIAWLAAVEPELEGRIHAAVPYHGGNVFKGLGDGAVAPAERIRKHLRCPVLGQFGAVDNNPSREDVEKLAELAGPLLEVRVHPNADHGFACKDSAKYMEEAASVAWDETLKFLTKTLGGTAVNENSRADL